MSETAPPLPFPIFRVSQTVERYLLYDVDIIMWLRKTHNILGVLAGTLPQIPSQNVFLSLPLELQPEEARVLIEKGLACVIDDLSWHKQTIVSTDTAQRDQLRVSLQREGIQIAKDIEKRKQAKSQRARQKISAQSEDITPYSRPGTPVTIAESKFDSPIQISRILPSESSGSDLQPWATTPTNTLPVPGRNDIAMLYSLPAVNPSSYALFKHLHQSGYFMTPGLRFGCHFSVYPGDPLRFHSHFLAVSVDWHEEIDLLHIVGGGRLGTGVKKSWMIGGIEDKKDLNERKAIVDKQQIDTPPSFRTFCIEWGGM